MDQLIKDTPVEPKSSEFDSGNHLVKRELTAASSSLDSTLIPRYTDQSTYNLHKIYKSVNT